MSLAFVWEGCTFHRGCPRAELRCTHALAEIYKYPRRSPPVGNRPFQRKHFVLGCTALPGCTAPLLRRVRLSELRWRWCSAEGSCITLHSCSTVANATLALARAQHDLTVIRLLSPPLRKSVRPATSSPALRYEQQFGVDFARLNMRLGSAMPARQCHHDFSATSCAPTVRLDAFLCVPMVHNDSCPQPKGTHFNCSATSTTVATTAVAVRSITPVPAMRSACLPPWFNSHLVCAVRNRTLVDRLARKTPLKHGPCSTCPPRSSCATRATGAWLTLLIPRRSFASLTSHA